MSEENVEIVRRIWDLYVEGMVKGARVPVIIDTVFDEGLLAPESTFTPMEQLLGVTETYVGREGFIEALRAFSESWAKWRIRPEKFLDAGEDRVVAIVSVSAIGKRSEAPVELRFGAVHTLKDGQVIDRRDYADPVEALEAAGLSE
jgi:ketosteroid isomerase-like protein